MVSCADIETALSCTGKARKNKAPVGVRKFSAEDKKYFRHYPVPNIPRKNLLAKEALIHTSGIPLVPVGLCARLGSEGGRPDVPPFIGAWRPSLWTPNFHSSPSLASIEQRKPPDRGGDKAGGCAAMGGARSQGAMACISRGDYGPRNQQIITRPASSYWLPCFT